MRSATTNAPQRSPTTTGAPGDPQIKRDTPDHWKVQALVRELHLPGRYAAVGILESLWHFTARYAPTGDLTPVPKKALAAWMGWPNPRTLYAALRAAGWLDGKGWIITVHHWSHHCEDSVHRALARTHRRFADGAYPNLNRLSPQERAAALAFYTPPPPKAPPAPARAAAQPPQHSTKANDAERIEILKACLKDYAIPGSDRILNWLTNPASPTPPVEHLWRVLAYGRQAQRQAATGGIKDLPRLWISLVQKAQFPPPDTDLQTARRSWTRNETALYPAPPALQATLDTITQKTHPQESGT